MCNDAAVNEERIPGIFGKNNMILKNWNSSEKTIFQFLDSNRKSNVRSAWNPETHSTGRRIWFFPKSLLAQYTEILVYSQKISFLKLCYDFEDSLRICIAKVLKRCRMTIFIAKIWFCWNILLYASNLQLEEAIQRKDVQLKQQQTTLEQSQKRISDLENDVVSLQVWSFLLYFFQFCTNHHFMDQFIFVGLFILNS